MVRVLGDVTGLGKSFDNAGAKGESAASKMHGAFRGVLDTLNQSGVLGPFGSALAGADAAISRLTGHGKEIAPVMMGAGAALVGIGASLQAMGAKDQAAHQQLQAAVEATGASYDTYAGRVEAAVKSQERYGSTANETQDALRKLTQATNDPAKALDYLQLAADLAAAKHEDLSTASGQLAKAMNGSGRILKEFGIKTKDASGATKDQKDIVAELSAKLSGQASAATNTFTGRINAMKAATLDHVSVFAQKYGPAITTAGAALTGLGATIQIVQAANEALKLGQIASTVATNAQTAAQWLLNAAMDANPIMLIVLALVALVAVVILAYTHCKTFRDIVDDMGRIASAAFGAVVGAASAAFGWVSAHWPLLLAILTGPFGIAALEIAKHWDGIVSLAEGIPGRITGALGDVGNILYDAGKNIIDGLGRGISDALKAVENTVSGIADKIKNLKGPLDVDRRLLVPQGHAIMQGLHEGLKAGIADVNALVSGVAPSISANVSPAMAPAAASGPAVLVEHAHFSSEVDVDAFMRRAAWAARTAAL
jgi:hypothetical protein